MGNESPQAIREIRINPIIPGESVLIATARSRRPKKEEPLAPHDGRSFVETCPFCRGNESKTHLPLRGSRRPATGACALWRTYIYPVLGGLWHTLDGSWKHTHNIRVRSS
jgi:UDPglucose--hexose-1-phosphate uridylyltransferase